MFSFGDKPRTKQRKHKPKRTIIRASDINPYVYKTVDEFVDNILIRLNKQQQGLGNILDGIQYHSGISPRHSPTVINLIKNIIQPYIKGTLFWVYESDRNICSYCGDYINLKICDNCNITIVSYDIDTVDDIYLNINSSANKQVMRFLGELQGNINYSVEEWNRIKPKLDLFFINADKSKYSTGGVLLNTSAEMMRRALIRIDECSTDSSVYYACIYYWNWNVFNFTRYISSYMKYISIIDSWCSAEKIRMNKMFKYYWISLIIGFDISRYYFRIPNEHIFISMTLIARNISKVRSVPVPENWII